MTIARSPLLALVLLFATACAIPAAARAEPGARFATDRTDVTLFVAAGHPRAADEGADAGSQRQPFASLGRALEAARKLLREGRSVRVAVAAGVYRDSVQFSVGADEGKARETLLIIQGDPSGGTILSGASGEGFEASTWKPVPGHANLYERPWTERRGVEPGPWGDRFGVAFTGVTARSEMLMVDGRRLTPVEVEAYEWVDDDGPARNKKNNADGQMVYRGVVEEGWAALTEPWQFAVTDHPDTPEPFRNRMVMRLPEGVTPADLESIEVGLPYESGLEVRGKNNLVIRHLAVQHYATRFLQTSLVINNCDNVLIEHVEVRDVGGRGLGLGSSDRITIRDSRFIRCGKHGMGGTRFTNALFERCDFSFNNWRGELSGYIGWSVGAIKITRSHDSVFRQCTAIGNKSSGFWNDINNGNILYDRCLSFANWRRGFFFELSGEDPADGDDRAVHCVSAYNGEEGFQFTNARRPVVERSLAINNGKAQFSLHRSGKRPPHDLAGFEWYMIRNSVAIAQNDAPVVMIRAYPDSGGEDVFAAARLNDNKYVSSNPSEAFVMAGKDDVSLAEWQRLLQARGRWDMNDQNSTMIEAPRSEPSPLELTNPKSPLSREIREMGVPLPVEDMELAVTQMRPRKD